jgi:hypothetical protein
MAEPNWFGHALRIGVFEFRRSVRSVRRDRARATLLAVGLVVPSLVLAGVLWLLSGPIRDAGPVALPPAVRGTVALLWLFGVFIVTQRVVSARPRIDAEPFVLTTVSARTAACGLLLAESLRTLTYVAAPTLVLTGAAVWLLGSPASLLLVPLSAAGFAVTTVLAGSILGYAIALLVATVPFVARHRTALGGLGVLVAMGGYLLLTLPQFGTIDQRALAWLPVGWLADLAVVGTPVRGSPVRVAAVAAGTPVLVTGGTALVARLATRLWFVDPVDPDGSGSGPEPSGSESSGPEALGPDAGASGRAALADAIAPVAVPRLADRPTRRVAQWTLLRTRREPRRLQFLLLPVLAAGGGLLGSGLGSGSLPTVLAGGGAVVLPWLAGATFGMNPFGDEGPVLPVALLSVPGSTYVRGLMLPGVLLGPPLVALVTALASLAGGFGPAAAAGLVGAGLLTTVVALTTAPAVGTWFPRFSAIRVGQSREVLPPRLSTTALHFLGVSLPGSLLALLIVDPGLARTLLATAVGFLPGGILGLLAGDTGLLGGVATWFWSVGTAVRATDLATFRLACGGALVAGGFAVAALSYRVAVVRFDRYSPPL